ncbi:uncharacterized protein PITG_00364 [Phytophthora infestans T30-4]|uniref:Uncharacterized protein n=1 Tax=Phytophthora infestans (strain T30-4) TaxID=403677 RepID=D0MQL7_PHYIT|nr:uncharacterized protein PITG_00364 [Phytophthora infestans T30-4]EEY57786.1 conserved hypothetical protein [Phytophthora infestans T30-4]|eukprot:XP_002908972.1 conserved hypothetical protein [Phytophthora infestans T30-4]
MTLLLETMRVVNNNLPSRIAEYDESELLADFTLGDGFRVTINNHTVTRSIVELYSSARIVACDVIDRSRDLGVPTFTVVCDMLTSKTQKSTKYLGLRLYFTDCELKLQSILLGTRHYEPMYGERSEGNIKWMMTTGLHLKWEWSMPHLTSAATKMAFGIVPQRCNSKNPEGTDLLSRIARTTYAIRSNATMGSLFAELCEMANTGASKQLLEHKDHRFMGLEKVIKPAPEGLPIADDKETLFQLYGLLNPVAALNTKSQKEDTNQVSVLLSVFRLRTTILDETQPIQDKAQPSSEPPLFYEVQNLTRLAKTTRALLAQAFHKNFFIRYTDPSRFRSTAYIPEMQLLLHPSTKNQAKTLAKIPHLRLDEHSVARNVASVKVAQQTVFSEDLMEFTEETAMTVVQRDVHEARVDEELDRWLADPTK